MKHHSNYFSSDLTSDQKAAFAAAIQAGAITGPAFVGCGWTRRCGSDSYGGYVVSISKTASGKPLIGLCNCHSEMAGRWEEGDMNCCLPNNAADPKDVNPTMWITTFGKSKKTGLPKWYFCDPEGKRFIPGQHCYYSWGACHEYQDPCF